MENVSVSHIGTSLITIKDNFKIDPELEANHYIYVNPSLNVNTVNKTTLFNVNIESAFEFTKVGVPYKISTLSQFELEKFTPHEDRYETLEDYVLLAYIKHLRILKANLNYPKYINKIRNNLERRQYDESLKLILYFAYQNSKTNLVRLSN